MTDPTPQPTGAGEVAASAAAPLASPDTASPAPALAGVPVPGERLPTPLGATRLIADYGRPRPSYVFLTLVSVATLAADVGTKAWAERRLDAYPGVVDVWKNHLSLVLAKNRGGAWGLLQGTSENVRRPFFLLVSVAAIAFIMTLYRRLQPRQQALRWGLPLVLGGALGNVLDRIRYGHVIDFIDAHVVYKGIDRHWPTFNVADIAICVGVGLMAVDMFTSKRGRPPALLSRVVPPAQSGEPVPDWTAPARGPAAHGSDGPTPVDEAPPAPAPGVETAEEPRAPEANR